MKVFIFIKSLVFSLLGIAVFNDKQKSLYRTDCFVFFAMMLTNVFVNTFIMIGGGIIGVVIYNMFVFGSAGVASFPQAFLAKRFGLVNAYRCGIITFILFYVSILLLGDNVQNFLWLAGGLSGISMCLFHVSRNMLILACADYDQDVESVYWGSSGMTNSIFTIALPPLAGVIISQIGAFTGYSTIGYYIVFSVGILSFVVAFWLSFRMQSIPPVKGEQNLWADAKILFKKKSVIFSGFGEMFRGVRDIISSFIFVSLVFYITQNETMVGTFTMVMAICQLVGFYIVARYLNLKRAKTFLFAFSIIVTVTPLALLWSAGAGMSAHIILLSLFFVGAMSHAVASFQNGANIICSNAIRGYLECGFLIREIFINVGRMIGLPILLILLGITDNIALNVGIAMTILGFMQIFMWLMHSRVTFKSIK